LYFEGVYNRKPNNIFSEIIFRFQFGFIHGIGFYKRNNIVVHRTLMLFGSIAMVIPAINRTPLVNETMPPLLVTIIIVLMLFGIPVALIIHDWLVLKRFPKYATMGFGLYILMIILVTVIPQTEWGLNFFKNYLSGTR